jgi:ABC-type amino acid transport substrate-binding protein
MVEGVFQVETLAGAIQREQPGSGELMSRIQARGVLSVGLPADRPGVSERDDGGIWRGVAVDLMRAIAEQLLGSADRVLFAQPAADGELRQSLRQGHLDLALLREDPEEADLAGDGDRSWSVLRATPAGDLTFLLPQNQSVFQQTVNRILQTPLQAELLGLTAARLSAAVELPLTMAQERFLDRQGTGEASSAGQGTPLERGFVSAVLKRLGNAAELWTRFFPGVMRPAPRLSNPLDIPVAGPALAAVPPAEVDGVDAVSAIAGRGVLRVAVAGGGATGETLLPWQQELLETVAARLGGAASAPVLALQPYATPSAGIGMLSVGQVDLLLPDGSDHQWLDGVVGVDQVALQRALRVQLLVTRRSGIRSLDELGGSRLGMSAGARVEAALRQRLSSSGATASVSRFPSLAQAFEALRLQQLDGLVVEGDGAAALQEHLANLGIETELVAEPLLEAAGEILLPLNQSSLRDVLQMAAAELRVEARG